MYSIVLLSLIYVSKSVLLRLGSGNCLVSPTTTIFLPLYIHYIHGIESSSAICEASSNIMISNNLDWIGGILIAI